jgi:CRP/FNR family transcriptional regulator, cyclic AMP receptor protein
MGKYVSFLKETDLFFNLSATQLELVESLCEENLFQEGDIISREGAQENELYLVVQGQVEILVNPALVSSGEGQTIQPKVISTMWRGQSFGEMALVDEGVRSASSRAAVKNTLLLRIPRQKFLLLCNTYPELGFRVMFNLATDLSQKIRNAGLLIREGFLNNPK